MIVRAVCASILLLAFPDIAQACSCAWPDLKTAAARKQHIARQIRASDAVFLGEVVAVNGFTAKFRVEKVWKGSVPASFELGAGTSMSGAMLRMNSCVLGFGESQGMKYVVFADADQFGRYTAHRCGPTMPLTHASGTVSILDALHLGRAPTEGSAARPHPELKQMFGAVLEETGLAPDDEVFVGEHLDAASRTALESLLGRQLREAPASRTHRVPANGVVMEWLNANENSGEVVATFGPVPVAYGPACGLRFGFPLRKDRREWKVDSDKAVTGCANRTRGVPGTRIYQVTEAFRIAMSDLFRGDAAVQFVAGPKLSDEAREMLGQFGPLVDATAVESKDFIVPAGVLRVDTVSAENGLALIDVWSGPAPRGAALGCGKGHKVRLKSAAGGWMLVEHSMTMC